MSGTNRGASAIKTPYFFKQLWVSERRNFMIATLNLIRAPLVALTLFVLAGLAWNASADSREKRQKQDASSDSDSYMGLSGQELWSNNCLRCHNIRPPTMYSNAQWDVIVHHMRIRANITGQEQRAIVEFLKSSK
jgi:hypothetical protein